MAKLATLFTSLILFSILGFQIHLFGLNQAQEKVVFATPISPISPIPTPSNIRNIYSNHLPILFKNAASLFPPTQPPGDEITQCLLPHPTRTYNIFNLNEPVHNTTGWETDNATFEPNGTAKFGNSITGGTAQFWKSLPLGMDTHTAVRVSITGQTSKSRPAWVIVRLGDAQEGKIETFGDVQSTLSITLAQGDFLEDEIYLDAWSGGVFTIFNIQVEPVDNLTRTTGVFMDPHLDGIDWPTWYEISQTTIISTGSRYVDAALNLTNVDNPLCTPIALANNLQFSDTITITFKHIQSGNRGGSIQFSAVEELEDALTADYSPITLIGNGNSYTLPVPITYNPSQPVNPGYLCFKATTGGSTGNFLIDDFGAIACEGENNGGGNLCLTLNPLAEAYWTLGGSATISNSILSLSVGDYAAQDISVIENENIPYQVVLSATGTTGLDQLAVSLAGISTTLTISETTTRYEYETTLTAGSNTTSSTLQLTGLAGQVEVSYICFSRVYTAGNEGDCVAPDNGSFDDASAWNFYHGGQWNASEQNALLPIEAEGIISQNVTLPVLPEVNGGNYWLLSFDARTKYAGGAAYVSLDGLDFTDTLTFTLVTMFQSYEVDASAYQESTWGLYFANLDAPDTVNSESDIYIDNVCLRWSANGPTSPPPPKRMLHNAKTIFKCLV